MYQLGKCKIPSEEAGCVYAELCCTLIHWCHRCTKKFFSNRTDTLALIDQTVRS